MQPGTAEAHTCAIECSRSPSEHAHNVRLTGAAHRVVLHRQLAVRCRQNSSSAARSGRRGHAGTAQAQARRSCGVPTRLPTVPKHAGSAQLVLPSSLLCRILLTHPSLVPNHLTCPWGRQGWRSTEAGWARVGGFWPPGIASKGAQRRTSGQHPHQMRCRQHAGTRCRCLSADACAGLLLAGRCKAPKQLLTPLTSLPMALRTALSQSQSLRLHQAQQWHNDD